EVVVTILRKRILGGEIEPGERIKELEISKELNISRGPVREALRQIEQEGLVSYSPNKGCTVKTISPSVMTEVYLIRSALEILAVKVYSGHMKQSTIIKLEELANNMGDMGKENNLYGIVENDEEFHSTIVKEAGVNTLFDTWKNFEGQNAAIYYTMRTSNVFPKAIKANHYMIIDAFKEKNLNSVCNVIQNHYMVVPEDLYKSKNMDKDKILNAKLCI
ncbi:MAG: GntR family transcriptional regulator, partial [Tissierellia bacterium]|nr:GntR family transcriptional regulator [Tissierellia bacterium]